MIERDRSHRVGVTHLRFMMLPVLARRGHRTPTLQCYHWLVKHLGTAQTSLASIQSFAQPLRCSLSSRRYRWFSMYRWIAAGLGVMLHDFCLIHRSHVASKPASFLFKARVRQRAIISPSPLMRAHLLQEARRTEPSHITQLTQDPAMGCSPIVGCNAACVRTKSNIG